MRLALARAALLLASLTVAADALAGPAASLLAAAQRMRSSNEFLESLDIFGYSLLSSSDAQFQGSVSAETPRILAAHAKGDVLFAFNQGVNVVEMMEFDGRNFIPHVIEFPAIVDLDGQVITRDNWAKSVVIDDPRRLKACPTCHIGRDLLPGEVPPPELFRPNWHQYSRWPDAMIPTDTLNEPQVMLDTLARFAAGNGQKGLYASLAKVFRFPAGAPKGLQYKMYDHRHVSLGAGYLTAAVFRSNYKRIVSQLFAAPGFRAYENAFFDWSKDGWTSRLPAAEKAQAATAIATITADQQRRVAGLQARELERIQRNYPGLSAEEVAAVNSRNDEHEPSQLRLKIAYMAERLGMGDRVSNWSTAYHGSYPDLPLLGNDGFRNETDWAPLALWKYRPSCFLKSGLSFCKRTMCDMADFSYL